MEAPDNVIGLNIVFYGPAAVSPVVENLNGEIVMEQIEYVGTQKFADRHQCRRRRKIL